MSENRRLHLRIGTAAEWATHNPILANGEPGYISDTRAMRIGDGSTAFASLPNFALPSTLVLPVAQGGTGATTAAAARTALGLLSMALQAASAVAITGGTISLLDSQKITLGTGLDLEIFHDGTNSIIREVGPGSLILDTNTSIILRKNNSGTETMAVFTPDGSVELYFNNVKVFETTVSGVTVTGALTIGSQLTTPFAQASVAPVATTSGTFFDTAMPSWVNRIDILLDGLSITTADHLLVQLGDAGGIETTGYVSGSRETSTTNTTGFVVFSGNDIRTTTGIVSLVRGTGNQWFCTHNVISGTIGSSGAGSKTLSAEITTLRLTVTAGAFDGGAFSVRYAI